ncbi:MAG: 16S rRNA (cytidine(1402)-2'-O)-methyltransferase [Pseudomonadota bacterium]
MEPGLYLAATPIGNLADITLRTLETLAGCNLIACEDTRVTGKLLKHYGISTKTISYHEHNAESVGPKLIKEVQSGKSVVIVSDAGTPVVSDPGFRLVVSAHEAKIPVWPLPGASAPLAALVKSGFDAETWTFAGFLPTKQGARRTRLKVLSNIPSTLIFFESPNRLQKSFMDMKSVFGGARKVCVLRELTKLHEDMVTGSLDELIDHYNGKTLKGEIVVVLEPPVEQEVADPEMLIQELLKTMSVGDAASEAASLTGRSKRDLYQIALELKKNNKSA